MRLVALLVKLLCVDKTLLVHNCYKFAATIIRGQIVQARREGGGDEVAAIVMCATVSQGITKSIDEQAYFNLI